jgi:hypothetical protein
LTDVLDRWQTERCSTVEISSCDGKQARQLVSDVLKHDRDDFGKYLKKRDKKDVGTIRAIKQIEGASLTGTGEAHIVFDSEV